VLGFRRRRARRRWCFTGAGFDRRACARRRCTRRRRRRTGAGL